MRLDQDGAELFSGAAHDALATLLRLSDSLPQDQAGVRLYNNPALQKILGPTGAILSLAQGVLGPLARPVRALMFDKSAKANWALGWHQDRTICVRERHEMPGFGPWTMKSGQHHVAPPAESLAQMVTMRIHLDDIGMDNAPLLIAPRSHVLGSVAETDIPNLVQKLGTYPCLAKAGDVWIYRTLILHASDRAINPTRRRVLQVDFAAFDLPSGLEWSGI